LNGIGLLMILAMRGARAVFLARGRFPCSRAKTEAGRVTEAVPGLW